MRASNNVYRIRELTAKLHPVLRTWVENVALLQPEAIENEPLFHSQMIIPFLSYVSAQYAEVISHPPRFREGFSQMLYMLRDELVVTYQKTTRLVDDFQARFSSVLLEGIKKHLL